MEFQSLKHLEKGDKAPYEGWMINNSDWKKLNKILAEIERKTSD